MKEIITEKKDEDLRQKIVEIAWKMFEEKGYENTTVADIIKAAGTSKGGFYYYFKAKEELLMSLYLVFDQEYKKFYERIDKNMNSVEQLLQIHQYVSYYIEANVGPEILTNMYIAQLTNKTDQTFWTSDRYYLKMLRKIVSDGQEKGEIRKDVPIEELAFHIMNLERAMLIDWCIQKGAYSAGYKGTGWMKLYLNFLTEGV